MVSNEVFSDLYETIREELSTPECEGKKQLKEKLKLLAENPLHPALRTKRIQGTSDLFECSVNMDIRVIWYYEGDRMIILVDIGHHDILDRY